jgi:hypothetical protein
MSKQPEALRLADWCEANSSGIYRPSADAAAELRRLHAINVELLEALRDVLDSLGALAKPHELSNYMDEWKRPFDAIAKAQEQS